MPFIKLVCPPKKNQKKNSYRELKVPKKLKLNFCRLKNMFVKLDFSKIQYRSTGGLSLFRLVLVIVSQVVGKPTHVTNTSRMQCYLLSHTFVIKAWVIGSNCLIQIISNIIKGTSSDVMTSMKKPLITMTMVFIS